MTIAITVGGTNITDNVHLTKSNFQAVVNGAVGTCVIALKDPTLAASFEIGDRILLTVDGLNLWAGYLMKIKHTYPFPSFSPPDRREFLLLGQDINILFQRRWIYKRSNPTGQSPAYPAYTSDTTVFADLFPDYINLGGDNIDVSTHVTHIGNINEDQKLDAGAAIWCSQPWMNTMSNLAGLLSPVWYINPDRQLVWADVDVESAPWGISDDPTTGEKGVREVTVFYDGTQMVNDVLFRGVSGEGSEAIYKRLTDDASVAAHGIWQDSKTFSQVYKQASLNRAANSEIYGSSSSKRGHKDDRVSINCSTFDTGLRAGMVVAVRLAAWGYQDNIPIRSMRISWPQHNLTRYDLTLSHELDTPYTPFDPIKVPTTPGTWVPPKPPKPPKKKPPVDGGCDDEVCGITDDFNRTTDPFYPSASGQSSLTTGWGTSSSGIQWESHCYSKKTGSAPYMAVNGTKGIVVLPVQPQGEFTSNSMGGIIRTKSDSSVDWDATFTLTIDSNDLSVDHYSEQGYIVGLSILDAAHSNWWSELDIYVFSPSTDDPSQGKIWFWGYLEDHYQDPGGVLGLNAGYTWDYPTWSWGSDYKVRMHWDSTERCMYGRVWLASEAEPSVWHAYVHEFLVGDPLPDNITFELGPGARWNYDYEFTIGFDDVNLPGANRCSAAQFDDFNRTVTDGWGTTLFGLPWTPASTRLDVDGSAGLISMPSIGSNSAYSTYVTAAIGVPAPWNKGSAFTMRARFMWVTASSSWSTLGFNFWRDTPAGGTSTTTVNWNGDIDLDGGTASASANIGAISAGTWYDIKIEFNPGSTLKAKVWTGSEPATWTVEVVDDLGPITDAAQSQFIIRQTAANQATFSYAIDYIDFDYDGKPCVPGSSSTLFYDTFTRTIAASDTGLGTSDSGHTWEPSSTWQTLTPWPYYCDGSSGWVDGTGYSGPYGTGMYTGVTGETPSDTATTTLYMRMATNCLSNIWFYQENLNAFKLLQISFLYSSPGYSVGVEKIALSSQWDDGVSYSDSAYGSTTDFPSGVGSGETVDLIVEYKPGSHTRCKVWDSDTEEPADWLISLDSSADASVDPGGPMVFGTYNIIDSESSTYLRMDEISLVATTDASYPTTAEEGSYEGRVCVDFTGGSSTFTTPTAFVPGSVVVFLNGALQSGITTDYPDQVSLGHTTASTDKVKICFDVDEGTWSYGI